MCVNREGRDHFSLRFDGFTHLPPDMAREALKRLQLVSVLPLYDQFHLVLPSLARTLFFDPHMSDEEHMSLAPIVFSALPAFSPTQGIGIRGASFPSRRARPRILLGDDTDLVTRRGRYRHGLAYQSAQNSLYSRDRRRGAERLTVGRSGRKKATKRGRTGSRDDLEPSIS